MREKAIFIDSEKLKIFIKDIFISLEVIEEEAEKVAEIIVETDLRGVYSHGVIRVPIYTKRIGLGFINPKSKIDIVRDYNASAALDANNCLGQISSEKAMQMAIEKADKYSVGVVVVKNSNHFGAAAAYALQAVEKDMIGFATTNAACRMAPTGGSEQIIGNNPFCYAIPAGEELPIILDVSCSVVALGKIILKMKKGENLPLGWVLDKNGNATTDPYAAIQGGGSLVPIGEHKGYGMALVFDILSGILSDSIGGIEVQSLYNLNTDKKLGAGHFFMAMKIDNFMPIDRFKHRIDERIKEIKNSSKKEGVKQIHLPGEIEFKNKEKNLRDGIPIAKEVVEELKKTAKELGINIDDYKIFK